MKQNLVLTITSLLSILLLTLHITDDVVRGISRAEPSNIRALSLTTPTVSRDFISYFFCPRTHPSYDTRIASVWLCCFTCVTPTRSGRFRFIDSVLPTKHLFGHDRPG
jgi:hypothetical protein